MEERKDIGRHKTIEMSDTLELYLAGESIIDPRKSLDSGSFGYLEYMGSQIYKSINNKHLERGITKVKGFIIGNDRIKLVRYDNKDHNLIYSINGRFIFEKGSELYCENKNRNYEIRLEGMKINQDFIDDPIKKLDLANELGLKREYFGFTTEKKGTGLEGYFKTEKVWAPIKITQKQGYLIKKPGNFLVGFLDSPAYLDRGIDPGSVNVTQVLAKSITEEKDHYHLRDVRVYCYSSDKKTDFVSHTDLRIPKDKVLLNHELIRKENIVLVNDTRRHAVVSGLTIVGLVGFGSIFFSKYNHQKLENKVSNLNNLDLGHSQPDLIQLPDLNKPEDLKKPEEVKTKLTIIPTKEKIMPLGTCSRLSVGKEIDWFECNPGNETLDKTFDRFFNKHKDYTRRFSAYVGEGNKLVRIRPGKNPLAQKYEKYKIRIQARHK